MGSENTESASVKAIPYLFAKEKGVFLEQDKGEPRICYRAGVSPGVIQEVSRHVGWGVPHRMLDKPEFERLLQKNYAEVNRTKDQEIGKDFTDEVLGDEDLTRILDEPDDLLNAQDDAPIIRLFNSILFEAIREKVSDIHIEPYAERLVIRFRLDGVLKSSLSSTVKIAPFLVTRIKVLARLDIAEKRVPQDGRMSVRVGGKNVDLRISTIPSAYGERVVLRLLDKEESNLDLAQLGMDDERREKLEELIQRPHGIILVTGPTGSGKTTTLYACLKKLDHQRLNIMTVEDPIEYYFDGISQTQVNMRANMTFARGLRAILRQDPDVVLVGEIRDTETASISVQASLTGHLVLSTLHTNTAVGAVTRLRDMGVEPFLLASTVQAVMSQRLLRRLCEECREPYKPSAYEKKILGGSPSQLYAAKGCEKCYKTGYSKRIAIYELAEVDKTLRGMINENVSEQKMADYAHSQTKSIQQNAFDLVCGGVTSFAEAVRVIRD